MTDYVATEKTIKQITADFSRIDVFVANSGAGKAFKIAGSDVADWHSLIDVVGHIYKMKEILLIVRRISTACTTVLALLDLSLKHRDQAISSSHHPCRR